MDEARRSKGNPTEVAAGMSSPWAPEWTKPAVDLIMKARADRYRMGVNAANAWLKFSSWQDDIQDFWDTARRPIFFESEWEQGASDAFHQAMPQHKATQSE